MILQLENVFASYGSYDVLHGVNMNVAESEIVCLIGPNGAGKSTVLKTIFGFLKPRPGRIFFLNEEISGEHPTNVLKKGISYVFQQHSVFPKMTVLENLEMGAYILNDVKKIQDRIEEVFVMFPILKERRRQMAGQMSGGQQRMIEIGRALMLNPQLLLLDEPTIGLAPVIIDEIFRKIVEINETGTSILMVEQNARKALGICHRACILENGVPRLEGAGEAILQNPEVKRMYLGGK